MRAILLLVLICIVGASTDIVFRNSRNITSDERPLYTVDLTFREPNSGLLIIVCLRRGYGKDNDGCSGGNLRACLKHGDSLYVERDWKITHNIDKQKWHLITPYINDTIFYTVIDWLHNCTELRYSDPKIKTGVLENVSTLLSNYYCILLLVIILVIA